MMLPYLPPFQIHLFGPFTLHIFGALVGTGVLLGMMYAQSLSHKEHAASIEKALGWALIPGFLFAHWLDVLFYTPNRIFQEGWIVLLQFWDGLSSFGGFVGGVLGLMIYYRWKKKKWLHEADIILQALLLGFTFGRLGCTFAHDHMGKLTHFFLAFRYPWGTRHNLGFYEFLFLLLVLFPLHFWLRNWKKKHFLPHGTFVFVYTSLYSIARFFLDFLRAQDLPTSDKRFFGLTFAQYGCVFFLFFLVWFYFAKIRPQIRSQSHLP